MSYVDTLRANLTEEEGERRFPYKDQFGNITIGIGRNLTGKGISEEEEALMFANDVGEAEVSAENLFPSFWSLTDNRKAVLADMAFNLGHTTLSGFHGLIAAVAAQDWNGAAQHMLDSKWAQQVGARATKLAQLMKDG